MDGADAATFSKNSSFTFGLYEGKSISAQVHAVAPNTYAISGIVWSMLEVRPYLSGISQFVFFVW